MARNNYITTTIQSIYPESKYPTNIPVSGSLHWMNEYKESTYK